MKTWDIFCNVIDNYGDAGVCWRLAADLAQRKQRVNLWIDQPQILSWLSDSTPANLSINHWHSNMAPIVAGDVIIEAFGCRIDQYIQPDSFSASQPQRQQWINLEYLTAEDYALRSHLLASPCYSGPLQGREKYFFYPGFTPASGGLLREADLSARQAAFNRDTWLKQFKIQRQAQQSIVSLFCYEPANLANFLRQLVLSQQAYLLLITAGRSQAIFQAAWAQIQTEFSQQQLQLLQFQQLPFISQTEFDHLLWSCDFNFVRGEDSLVRALWAGKPFIWQIYPQDDGVHFSKLTAFLDYYLANCSTELRQNIEYWFNWWNAAGSSQPAKDIAALFQPNWLAVTQQNRQQLQQQASLTEKLLRFVDKKSLQYPC